MTNYASTQLTKLWPWPISPKAGQALSTAPHGEAVLGEISHLTTDQALLRLSSSSDGLAADEADTRLRSNGPNRVAHGDQQTALGEIVSGAINPLNLLLIGLAVVSYFLGDARAAIVIAIWWSSVSRSRSCRNTDQTRPPPNCSKWSPPR